MAIIFRNRVASALIALGAFALAPAAAEDLRVMATGLGAGTISGPGVACNQDGAPDCDGSYATGASVLLTATPAAGSYIASWGGDCPDADPATPSDQCLVPMTSLRSVRVQFGLTGAYPTLTPAQIADVETTRSGIGDFLAANAEIDTPAEFIAALPLEYRRNWILMPRSESLQTGVADSPRLMLVTNDGANAFTVGFREHRSYPAAFPMSVEFMQWDDAKKSFRFHDIALKPVPDLDDTDPVTPGMQARFPGKPRGVTIDDTRCFACHSTGNIPNRGTTAGTDGIPAGSVPAMMKPNWDAYDSWGGMLPFNRDRVYKGTVEAAALRRIFNPWNWRNKPEARRVLEQIDLQPPGVPDGSATLTRTHGQDSGGIIAVDVDDRITRIDTGGANDGHVVFAFDAPGAPTTVEPAPTGTGPSISYSFGQSPVAASVVARANPGETDPLEQYRKFVTLHRWTSLRSDAARGVLFLESVSSNYNTQRVVRELINHRYATGNAPVDVRPLALAIAAECISVAGGGDPSATQTISPAPPAAAETFFNARNGLTFNEVYDDTRWRQNSLPRRKVDIQRLSLDRFEDPYVFDENGPAFPPAAPEIVNGLIQEYGAATAAGAADTGAPRLRQEIFRREVDRGGPDSTAMGGNFVDREDYREAFSPSVALFRYFLEPLGVSVDKWSTSTRGRSRTYTFSASFGNYLAAMIATEPGGLRESLGIPETTTDVCPIVMPMVDALYASLPAPDAIPTFTDVQRIFNKGCIECHGGLGYPPYRNYGDGVNFAENENPAPGERRLWRSLTMARSLTGSPVCPASAPTCPVGSGTDPSSSYLFQRITDNGNLTHPYDPATANEHCPEGLMPCGGPPLSKTDIETVRRWIVGGRANTEGDPHIKTVENVRYDFQAAGEFTLLRGEDMELQARQTPVTTAAPLPADLHTGLSACVSVNTAVALKIGPHRVTYQPDLGKMANERAVAQMQSRPLILRIDGKPVDVSTGPIALSTGGRVLKTSAPGGVEVQIPGGTSVVVTPGFWSAHNINYMNIDVRHARAIEGVMGSIAPGGWLPALSDGGQLGAKPSGASARYATLYKKFADSWRVTRTTSHFDYEPGLAAGAFDVRDWPGDESKGAASCAAPAVPGGSTRKDPAPPMRLAEAKALCAPIADPARRRNCAVDVAATGDKSFAEVYQLTERLANAPQPPQPVLVAPADNAALPSKSVSFDWRAGKGEQGRAVKYHLCLWRGGETFDYNKCLASSLQNTGAGGKTDAKRKSELLDAARKKARDFASKRLGLPASSSGAGQTVNRLTPGSVYYWKVLAEDADGAYVESATRRFTVK